ncbi:MAG: xylulokinase, partial [Actinomycetota bacterium]|nr:xylulokinase [Actinomycetota bacterium]
MKKNILLGVDFGTGGCKITVIDDNGNIMAEASKEYITHHPKLQHSEQNPHDWLKSFIECLKKVKNIKDIDMDDIVAMSFDDSTHNAVLLDKNMEVIRPTIMWTDQRSVKEVEYLEKNWGEDIFKIGYQKVAPTWTLPQLLWIKNNEPHNFEKIDKIMFVKDYVRYLLTENWITDYIDAQGSLLFDIDKKKWSETLCGFIGLDPKTLPPICSPTDIVGKITKKASEITGLREGIPVICGTSDSAVEDYAAGAIEAGQCILKLATAGNVNVMTDKPFPNPLTLTYSHVIPGMWYTVSATNTAASAMRWFRDNFCYEETQKSISENINVFNLIEEEVASVSPGSKGLVFSPYLLGERAPYWDPYLRASFVGATMAHKKSHFLRALMEGVGFSLKDCYRVIEDMHLNVKEFILIGGGSKGNVWSQIICDIFGEKIIKPEVSDASYGSALLAAVGIGIF